MSDYESHSLEVARSTAGGTKVTLGGVDITESFRTVRVTPDHREEMLKFRDLRDDYDICSLAIYIVDPHGAAREVACCDDDALAFTLRELTAEGQINETNDVGVLDRESCSWLLSPYPASVFGRRTETPA